MSAFMCSDKHLSVLAGYAVRNNLSGIVDGGQGFAAMAKEVFGVLARSNAASVDYRYRSKPAQAGDLSTFSVKDAYGFADVPTLHIIKACHCYAYQSCEYPGWEATRAKAIIDRIESHAVRHLPGYNDAPWGL